MKSDIVLVRPTLELKEKALAYRREHFRHGENIICGSSNQCGECRILGILQCETELHGNS